MEEKWMVGRSFWRAIIIGGKCQVGGMLRASAPLHWSTALSVGDCSRVCARSGAAVSQASGSRSAGWHAARDSHPKPQEIPAICHPYKITFPI